ncbi:MAG: hypothetical protein MJE68_06630, partial [Proteobacteria bacterium]|nr:hypothetical protein [Pseudomonadota bacterium]
IFGANWAMVEMCTHLNPSGIELILIVTGTEVINEEWNSKDEWNPKEKWNSGGGENIHSYQ